MCFCLSTAYEGTYLGSYHLDLLIKPQVQIHRHSVPIFIPLEHIAKQYLQTDIRRFLVVLSDHLNAYTARRYQAEQLQVPVTTAAPSFSLPSVVSLRSAGWNLSSFPCVALTLRVWACLKRWFKSSPCEGRSMSSAGSARVVWTEGPCTRSAPSPSLVDSCRVPGIVSVPPGALFRLDRGSCAEQLLVQLAGF